MKVAVSAGGRFHAFQLAHQLYKRKSLERFFTFSYTKGDRIAVPENVVTNIGLCGNLDYLAQKVRLGKFISLSSFNVFKDNLFDRSVKKKIKNLGNIDIFVGWAHYALHSLPEIKKTGAKVIVESGSSHILEQQKLLQEEYEKWGVSYQPIHNKNSEKMLAEYEQADYIMTLSNFSRESFIRQGIAPEKILKVPCGMDVDFFSQGKRQPSKKFRVIFVGLINIRKGVHYLLQAWNKLNLPEDQTELIFVGNMSKDIKQVLKTIPVKNNVTFYGSTTRAGLRDLFYDSSLFVLPSVEDGFGMVIGEAMAAGLPVICSDHTAGPEIIQHGREGFIVHAGNVDQLIRTITWCYDNQEAARHMGAVGSETIKKFTWDEYGDNVYKAYEKILLK